jgi:hypothetical protein
MTLMIAMTLHEQARVLRTLASVEDHPFIKNDLFKLAQKCEELASAALTSTETCAGTIVDAHGSF